MADTDALRDELETACKAGALTKIVKRAEAVLAVDASDPEARQALCVALSRKGKCAEALEACGAHPDLDGVRAYCQYMLGDLDAALASCAAAGGGCGGAASHVEAQTRYKRGEYAEAARIYAAMLDDGSPRSGDDRRELETNYYAAHCLAREGAAATKRLEPPKDAVADYELAYNRGCCELDAGGHAAAKGLLAAALDGATAATEGEPDAERRAEIAPFAAQLAVAECLDGDGAAAADRCRALLKDRPADAAVAFSAANTLAASRDGADLFDSHKRLKHFVGDGVARTDAQSTALRFNWASVLAAMGKTGEAEAVLSAEPFADDADACDAQLLMITSKLAAAAKRGGGGADVVPAIEAAIADTERRGIDTARLRFALAQALADRGDLAGAEAALAASSAADRVAVLACRADLLDASGEKDKAIAVLARVEPSDDDGAMRLAFHRLRLGDNAGAAAAMATVDERGNEAKLALLQAFNDASEAQRLVGLLGLDDDDDEAIDAIDAAALLEAGVPRELARARPFKGVDGLRPAAALSPEELENAAALRREAALKRRAKKRTAYLARLSADGKFDPRNPSAPDPERWIAKKQRSYNKRGRKNKTKFTGAQGGDANIKDVAKLDAAARAKEKRDAEAKAGEDAAAEAAAGGGGSKKKRTGNRKKKGN